VGPLKLHETSNAAYAAKIELGTTRLVVPANGIRQIPLAITNLSDEAWTVQDVDQTPYGVSFHLHDQAGNLLEWERPRTLFIRPRARSLAFLPPGASIACRLAVNAPDTRGRYRLQLDIVRENVAWFSWLGVKFPIVELKVV
jgi:hypothetical protein